MKLISLFSGAGGLDKGFHNAGFRTVVANEFDSKICPTFKANFPDTHLIESDIRSVKESKFPERVTGIIGIEDARGQLFYEYIRILKSTNLYFLLLRMCRACWLNVILRLLRVL